MHTVIGVILTVQSLQTAKQSGKMYLKQNAIFWGETSQWAGNTDPAVLPYWLVWKGAEWDIYFVPFYNGKDGNSALFVAAIFVHILSISAHCSYRWESSVIKKRRGDIYLILSVLLLFIAGAVIFYYIGWQYL